MTLELHRYDDLVDTAVIELAGARTIAVPWSMRSSVPRMLESGVVPVLYHPDTVSPQGLAILGVEYILAPEHSDRGPLAAALAPREIEGTVLAVLDLHSALAQPLTKGTLVDWKYSRPYTYRPIRDCLVIASGEQEEYELTLAAGTYEIRVEAFAKSKGAGELQISIVSEGTAMSEVWKLKPVVYEPIRYTFRIDSGPNRHVQILIEAREEEGDAYVHRVTVERTS